ncbi:hypothetical protein [Mangrovicoccus sp. HB161399]|uniref:hypothetical protein n=1 Tax=Mangrovicoccus sp. HB161399 TaxID=2720392 RepID=UPI001551EB97|nr:hypothetical protein [Mangrovicoccus sp. HB161399]
MRPGQLIAYGLGHVFLAALSAGVAAFVTVMLLSGAGAPLRAAIGLPAAEFAALPCRSPAPQQDLAASRAQPPPDGGGRQVTFTRPKPLDLSPREPFIRTD